MQSNGLVDVNSLIESPPTQSTSKSVDVSSLIEEPQKKNLGGSDLSNGVQTSFHTESPLPLQEKSKGEFDNQNPIDLAKQAAELSTKSNIINVPSMEIGGGAVEVPDENAVKQSKKINDYLKSQNLDPKKINQVFGDVPEQAFDMTLPDGTKPQSKEVLFNEWKSNPIDTENKINNIKTQFALQDAGKNEALQTNPNDPHIAEQAGIRLGNEFMQLQGTPVTSLSQYYDKIEKQKQLINNNLTGDQRDKALQRLQSTSAPNINASQPELLQEYDQSPLKNVVNPNEYAGLQTLKLFDPEKYQQAINILQTQITPTYTNPTNVPAGTLSGGAPIPATFQSTTKEKGGTLSQQTIDQQIAQENIHRQLLNIGRENELTQLTAQQYNLNKQYEQTPDENAKQQIQGQYLINQDKINQIKADAANDDKRFPLTANLKFDNEVKDLTGQTNVGLMQFGTERFLKGFQNTQNTAEDLLTNLFGSKQDKTNLDMKRMGESANWQSEMYLPEQLRTSNSPYILQASKSLKDQANKILNGRSLSDLSPDEANELKDLIAKNPSQITTVVSPDGDKSKNFFSKATAYATAGFTGDIASFMAQTYGLGALGMSGKAAEATTLFNTSYSDAYDEAINEGDSPSIANQKALVNGGIMALAGIVSSKYDVVKEMLQGGKSPISKEIAGIGEGAWNNIVEKNKGVINKIKNSITSTAGENAKMIATYGVGTSIAQDLANKALFNKKISTDEIINHALESSKQMALGSAALMGVGFITHLMKSPVTMMDKSNLWELGSNPELGIAKIDEALQNNQITSQQAEQRKAVINKVSDLIQTVPEVNQKGKPLTDEQKVRYMYNEFLKTKVREADKGLPEAQQEKNEQISESADQENNKIISGNEKENQIPVTEEKASTPNEGVNQTEQPAEPSKETISNNKKRTKIIINHLLDNEGDVGGAFEKAGYVNHNGIWVAPEAIEYAKKVSPKVWQHLKDNGITYLQGGDGGRGMQESFKSPDNGTIRGIGVNENVGDFHTGHDHTVLHELAHHVWQEELTPEQKALFKDGNPISDYAKSVKKGNESTMGEYDEEDFAELYAKNNGDVQKAIEEKKNQSEQQPVPSKEPIAEPKDINTTDYRGEHQIVTPITTADNLEGGGSGFEWKFSAQDWEGQHYKESLAKLKSIKDKPDAEVTIYRAVPKGVKDINEGDWISLSKTYAKEHGMHETDASKDMPVISKKVKAKDIGWDGNDLNEFVYNPKKAEQQPSKEPISEPTNKEENKPESIYSIFEKRDLDELRKNITAIDVEKLLRKLEKEGKLKIEC